MSVVLDIESVCRRGFSDTDSLTPKERLVYLLADLEICIEMEGWDHFFTSPRMRYYRDLIDELQAAGDSVSQEILLDYERHFHRHGVAFEPAAIGAFLSDPPERYLSTCRDWQTDFERAKEVRWNKVEEYLSRYGYKLVA